MNAITPLALPAAETWPSIWSNVNTWRGRAMDEFARAEAAVSDALLFLSELPGRGEAVSLPHLVGQRYAALSELVGENGTFAAEGKGVAKSLAEWSGHHTFRTLLCHGMATVTLDHRGRWHLVMKMLTFRSGEAVRESMVIDEEEAAERLTVLHAARQRLEGRLRGMTAGICR